MQELTHCDCKIYDLEYYQDEGLHTLEAFAEGKFKIAGKLEVERKYIKSGDSKLEIAKGLTGGNFTYYTKVSNIEDSSRAARGQVGIVHGFSEESDIFLELAYQLALNNFTVHLIDTDAYGFSSGVRGQGPNVEKFHHNLTALIGEFEEGLPTFLYGNSMGCLIIATFLLNNPSLKLQGLVFSSPFFEFAEHIGVTWDRKIVARAMAPTLELFAMQGTVMVHRVGRDMNYIRKALQQRKSFTIINMQGLVNLMDALEYLQGNVSRFSFPFLMMQGSEDRIVSNQGALNWYSQLPSSVPREKEMFPSMVHELHKEPGKEKVY